MSICLERSFLETGIAIFCCMPTTLSSGVAPCTSMHFYFFSLASCPFILTQSQMCLLYSLPKIYILNKDDFYCVMHNISDGISRVIADCWGEFCSCSCSDSVFQFTAVLTLSLKLLLECQWFLFRNSLIFAFY